ncbi:MAG: response regulator transcription factor [Planctomycetota bacterium]|jgi:two-component system alkaline phosphatase synthesis response regulator PhoP
METILVVEDDPSIRLGLTRNLSYEGYTVLSAGTGHDGLDAVFREKPDLVLLDVMLPGPSGLEICKSIRRHDPTLPILILSAKTQERDRVTGLDLGADDYISKPFSVRELLARVRTALRRKRAMAGEEKPVRFGRCELDFAARVLRVNEEEQDCSAKEFELLRYLVRNRGRVVSRDQILNRVWGYDYEGTARTIDNFIQKLRQKIEDDPDKPSWIRTVRGVGYRFESEGEATEDES